MTIQGLLALLIAAAQAGPVYTPPGTHPYSMNSASMEPTFYEGDVMLADRPRGECGQTVPEPGDIVIFQRNDTPWIKRVIAGPGQTVRVVGGVLFVDGRAVKRERAAPVSGVPYFPDAAVWRETLPNGRSYLTTDFGPGQSLDDILELTVPEGSWFLLGDNRDNSLDSRVFGPVTEAALCGVVIKTVSGRST